MEFGYLTEHMTDIFLGFKRKIKKLPFPKSSTELNSLSETNPEYNYWSNISDQQIVYRQKKKRQINIIKQIHSSFSFESKSKII